MRRHLRAYPLISVKGGYFEQCGASLKPTPYSPLCVAHIKLIIVTLLGATLGKELFPAQVICETLYLLEQLL